MRHSQAGSALGEQLIAYAVMALYCALLAVTFSQSLVAGFSIIGLTIVVGLLIFAFGYFRDRQAERRLVEARRFDLEKAAADHNAAIETVFVGRGEGGVVAVFGVAGAARKLIFARETYQKERTRVLDFDQLSAAFARPDGENRYRLEVRARPGDRGSQRAALFVTLMRREEAGRWVQILQPHLGDRVRFVETADD